MSRLTLLLLQDVRHGYSFVRAPFFYALVIIAPGPDSCRLHRYTTRLQPSLLTTSADKTLKITDLETGEVRAYSCVRQFVGRFIELTSSACLL